MLSGPLLMNRTTASGRLQRFISAVFVSASRLGIYLDPVALQTLDLVPFHQIPS